ncbi:hypothetical protein FDB55_09530 [Clostridium botulinum]|uniref:Uncharacterized protein n=2 Tax=Clostridium botulinum TaxID=1491 RepID=B2THV6_CLOBB|nr:MULTISPECIES: hypothetical protein [Clostridium]ACD21722.1 conserved hypothetical protein [Clostridium botulinum B str. Eklund 17B (NRP)]AIY81202.1 hypothetical protein U728_2599 [Clostridium botulinum 202F]ACD52229.1 conserved hypothetical protein [Clostridium botulinum E3 str. Alaska E43]AJF28208.1 hypothetical protein ST13_00390 [Clostridium botulinum]AJF31268.1 hypothetical protein ST12_00390 [Clostridium botulinum]
MKEENLKIAQQDIENALKTVQDMEKSLSENADSKEQIKEKFILLSETVQNLENILKNEGIL